MIFTCYQWGRSLSGLRKFRWCHYHRTWKILWIYPSYFRVPIYSLIIPPKIHWKVNFYRFLLSALNCVDIVFCFYVLPVEIVILFSLNFTVFWPNEFLSKNYIHWIFTYILIKIFDFHLYCSVFSALPSYFLFCNSFIVLLKYLHCVINPV